MSLPVVTIGPEATAGSIPIRSKASGSSDPIREASTIARKSEAATTAL